MSKLKNLFSTLSKRRNKMKPQRIFIVLSILLSVMVGIVISTLLAAPIETIPYGPIMWGMNPSKDYTQETLEAFSGGKWSLYHTGKPEAALAAARERGIKVFPSIGELNPCRYWNSNTLTFNYNLFMADVASTIPLVAQYYPDTIVGVSLLNEPHWINHPTATCYSGVPPKYIYELARRVRAEFTKHRVVGIPIGPNSHPGYINNSIGFPKYIEPSGGGQLTEAQKADGTIDIAWIYYHTSADLGFARNQQAIAKKYGWKIIYNTNASKAGTQLVETGKWHCQQEDAIFVTWWSWAKQNQQVPISALAEVRKVCDRGVPPEPPTPTLVPPTVTPPVIPTTTPTPPGPTPTSTPILGQLVIEYRLNEDTGNMALDSSGNNIHATLKGPTWTGGRYGAGLEFDGINDTLDASNSSLFNVNQYTLMAWVKQDTRGSDRQEVIEKSDAYWINIRNDTGKLRSGGFYGGCSASNWKYFDSADIIPLGTWTHVATTYDGSQLKIFIDGEFSGALSVVGETCSNSNPLIIGAKNASTAVFNGVIDEVRIYSYALTQAEVVEAMNDSGEMPTPTPVPPTPMPTVTPTATPTVIPTPIPPVYNLVEVMKVLLSRELKALPMTNQLTVVAKSDGFPVQVTELHTISLLGDRYIYQVFANDVEYRLYYCETLNCIPKWTK